MSQSHKVVKLDEIEAQTESPDLGHEDFYVVHTGSARFTPRGDDGLTAVVGSQ